MVMGPEYLWWDLHTDVGLNQKMKDQTGICDWDMSFTGWLNIRKRELMPDKE